MKPFMHRNDLKFYSLDKLIEMCACLGVQITGAEMQEIELVKDAICKWHASMPPFMQPHTDKFIGAFR